MEECVKLGVVNVRSGGAGAGGGRFLTRPMRPLSPLHFLLYDVTTCLHFILIYLITRKAYTLAGNVKGVVFDR